MKFFGKLVLKVVFSLLMLIAIGFTLDSTIEHIIARNKVNDFMDLGVYQENISTRSIKYYKVPSKDGKKGYEMYNGIMLPGVKGDILATGCSEMPYVGSIVSFYAGGHSSIVAGEFKDHNDESTAYDLIEVAGLDPDDNPVRFYNRYYWTTREYYQNMMALRCSLSEEEIDEIISYATGLIGDPYNYSFTFDTENKSYCSDLVSKVYDKLGKNFNKDSFWTTVWDIIVSDASDIVFYQYYDKDNIRHVYYTE